MGLQSEVCEHLLVHFVCKHVLMHVAALNPWSLFWKCIVWGFGAEDPNLHDIGVEVQAGRRATQQSLQAKVKKTRRTLKTVGTWTGTLSHLGRMGAQQLRVFWLLTMNA